MSVEEHGLVTGGEDGSIILWKVCFQNADHIHLIVSGL